MFEKGERGSRDDLKEGKINQEVYMKVSTGGWWMVDGGWSLFTPGDFLCTTNHTEDNCYMLATELVVVKH